MLRWHAYAAKSPAKQLGVTVNAVQDGGVGFGFDTMLIGFN